MRRDSRFKRDELPQQRDGGLVVPGSHRHRDLAREAVAFELALRRVRRRGLEALVLLEFALGLVGLPQPRQRRGQHVVRLRLRRIQGEGRPRRAYGLRVVAGAQVQLGDADVAEDVARIDEQRGGELRQRLHRSALADVGIAEPAMRVGVAGIDRHLPAERVDRVREVGLVGVDQRHHLVQRILADERA